MKQFGLLALLLIYSADVGARCQMKPGMVSVDWTRELPIDTYIFSGRCAPSHRRPADAMGYHGWFGSCISPCTEGRLAWIGQGRAIASRTGDAAAVLASARFRLYQFVRPLPYQPVQAFGRDIRMGSFETVGIFANHPGQMAVTPIP